MISFRRVFIAVGIIMNSHHFHYFYSLHIHVPSTGHWVTMTAGPCNRALLVLQGDKGGERVLQKKWTTFLKAQLLCSLPDDGFPFNIIQDMFVLTPRPEDWKNTVFYGVFTSQWWGNTLSLRHTVHMRECVGFSIDLGNEIFCVWVGWYYTHLLNNIFHTVYSRLSLTQSWANSHTSIPSVCLWCIGDIIDHVLYISLALLSE